MASCHTIAMITYGSAQDNTIVKNLCNDYEAAILLYEQDCPPVRVS